MLKKINLVFLVIFLPFLSGCFSFTCRYKVYETVITSAPLYQSTGLVSSGNKIFINNNLIIYQDKVDEKEAKPVDIVRYLIGQGFIIAEKEEADIAIELKPLREEKQSWFSRPYIIFDFLAIFRKKKSGETIVKEYRVLQRLQLNGSTLGYDIEDKVCKRISYDSYKFYRNEEF